MKGLLIAFRMFVEVDSIIDYAPCTLLLHDAMEAER